jgi:hypothetical protein
MNLMLFDCGCVTVLHSKTHPSCPCSHFRQVFFLPFPVCSETPQGSTLGTLYFIIFISKLYARIQFYDLLFIDNFTMLSAIIYAGSYKLL